jgi:hypothetical protein
MAVHDVRAKLSNNIRKLRQTVQKREGKPLRQVEVPHTNRLHEIDIAAASRCYRNNTSGLHLLGSDIYRNVNYSVPATFQMIEQMQNA